MEFLTPGDITALLDQQLIGDNEESFALTLKQQHAAASINMARQAKRSIHIYSHDLDRAVYNNRDFVNTLTRLASSSRHARIQILVRDTNPMIQHGHMVIEPARRLSTYITIKKVHPDFHDFTQAFFVVDERALIKRPIATRYEGLACFDAPREARELLRFFKEVWQKSEPEPKLRRLHI